MSAWYSCVSVVNIGPVERADEVLLTRYDVVEIVVELLPVQTKSMLLGRLVGLPTATIDVILDQNKNDLEKQLFWIIEEFVKQTEPRPTWRVILNALRNPLLRKDHLAREIEGKLFPTRIGMWQNKQYCHSHYKKHAPLLLCDILLYICIVTHVFLPFPK